MQAIVRVRRPICTALSGSSLWLKHRDLSFSCTVEVESRSVEFISVIEASKSVSDCPQCNDLYQWRSLSLLAACSYQYWATGDVVKLFIKIPICVILCWLYKCIVSCCLWDAYNKKPAEISSAQAQAQAGGIAGGVIVFIGCTIALFIGIVCYRKGVCKKSTPRPSQLRNNRQTPITTHPLASFPTVGSNTTNLNNAYTTTFVTTSPPNGTQHLYQQPQRLYQPQPSYIHSATTTVDEPSYYHKAATHVGEAPPAYHTAMHYETMTIEDYKSLKLSEGSAVYSAKPDSGNTDTPPTYSEIISGQEEKSVNHE